ncbi:MAG: ABC transporter permease [Lachnospiraceae bacterium]|nr:ABC transporter permease [Lachnospiraceae bacterium]
MKDRTKDTLLSILASIVCIVIGLAVGLIILYCINAENALDGFSRIIKGGFYLAPKGIGSEIFQAAPLIMTGLSVAFAFKTGLFNIGAAGQYTVGVFGALYFAIILHLPWYACLLAAAVCGAVWGSVPGIFKAYFNVNEVITSIMFNWIGLYLVNELLYRGFGGAMYDSNTTRTYKLGSVSPQSVIPDLGLNSLFKTKSTTIAIFIAIIIAILMYIILNKTAFGYELKACGFNQDAAKYTGINSKKNVVLSMTISGALAGIGAGLYYLSGGAEWNPQVSTALPAIGFNGIPVALLAMSNPVGVIFAALFVAHISVGGAYLPTKFFQPEIADIVVAVIIYLCAFVALFKGIVLQRLGKKKKGKEKGGK